MQSATTASILSARSALSIRHPRRHTFASLLIDSGENPKAVQEFMGHSTITVTFDLYGHLFPGSRDEARARMDAYLEAELAEAGGPTVDQ